MKSRYSSAAMLLVLLPLFRLVAAPQADAKQDQRSSATAESPRFDNLVRADFFAGMAGDQARFDRAMQLCETTLAKNPQHAEAMVWHGSGLLFRSGQAARKGDFSQYEVLFQNGLDEMDHAVALAPDNPSVLLPRGATLLSASANPMLPSELTQKFLQKGVQDYEKVLELQAPYFATLPVHARGELLTGLADGWHRLGDSNKARAYFQRIVKECAGSTYASDSEMWLSGKQAPSQRRTCQGCHTK